MSNQAKHIDIPGGEGKVWQELHKALADAFPNPVNLGPVLLELRDNINNHYGLHTQPPAAIDSIITKFNAAWSIDQLVQVALRHQPTNGYLHAFALKRGIEKKLPATNSELHHGGDSLERMLDEQRGFTNPMDLIKRMGQIVNAVCHIEVADKPSGTGFLVSKNVVMTNYHVVNRVIEKSPGFTPERIKIRFDYQTPAGGGEPTPGTDFTLVEGDGWLVDSSKYDPQDVTVRPRDETLALERAVDHLDYALLRIAGNPGEANVGDTGVQRGHLTISADGPDYTKVFQPTSGVFIFQHPRDAESPELKALPLRVDWEKPADVAMDEKETRVVYNVNTRKGSSGSPCFSPKLELIALHHSGGKDWPAESNYLYNQGIPIDKIRDLLKNRNKWNEI